MNDTTEENWYTIHGQIATSYSHKSGWTVVERTGTEEDGQAVAYNLNTDEWLYAIDGTPFVSAFIAILAVEAHLRGEYP